MAVFLSPVGGVAAQFFTNTGAVLTGGKIYTYAAGTTTPAVTYTNSGGVTAWTNPIVLDAAGRVSGSGEIWLSDGVSYKFVLKDSNDVLIATYDNIIGINASFSNFIGSQEIQVATAGQTVFTLANAYTPGANTLSVFVDGVNQYGPGAQYAYLETSANTVTFASGLHVGASVKFTTIQTLTTTQATDASLVSYNEGDSGAVTYTVQAKLRQYVSVKDFGAVGDGVTDDTIAINAALATYKSVYFPNGTYMTTGNHELLFQHPTTNAILRQSLIGEGNAVIKRLSGTNILLKCQQQAQATVSNLTFDGNSLGGVLLLWRGHYSLLERLKFKSQGGTSYALWLSGVNTSQFNDLEFGDSCYGGVLVDNANDPTTPTYGMLYSDIFKLQIGSTNGGAAVKFAPASTVISVTFNDCLIEGNTGGSVPVIDLDAQLQKSITFNNINGEYANLGTSPYIYVRGDESVDIAFEGGYWVSNYAQNIATPVIQTDVFVRGLTINNVFFSENYATATSAGRTLIYLEDARNVTITNCTAQFINNYYFVESAATNLNTYVTLANNFQYNINYGGGANFAGIATCTLQTDYTNVSNTNMLINVSTTQKYSIQNSNQVRSVRAAGAITVADDGYYEIHGDGGVSAAGDWAGTLTIRCGDISATSKNNFATFYAQTGSGAGFPDHTDISVGSNVEILDQDNAVAALANTTDGKLGVQIGYAGGGANRYIRIYNRTGASVTLFADVLLMI